MSAAPPPGLGPVFPLPPRGEPVPLQREPELKEKEHKLRALPLVPVLFTQSNVDREAREILNDVKVRATPAQTLKELHGCLNILVEGLDSFPKKDSQKESKEVGNIKDGIVAIRKKIDKEFTVSHPPLTPVVIVRKLLELRNELVDLYTTTFFLEDLKGLKIFDGVIPAESLLHIFDHFHSRLVLSKQILLGPGATSQIPVVINRALQKDLPDLAMDALRLLHINDQLGMFQEIVRHYRAKSDQRNTGFKPNTDTLRGMALILENPHLARSADFPLRRTVTDNTISFACTPFQEFNGEEVLQQVEPDLRKFYLLFLDAAEYINLNEKLPGNFIELVLLARRVFKDDARDHILGFLGASAAQHDQIQIAVDIARGMPPIDERVKDYDEDPQWELFQSILNYCEEQLESLEDKKTIDEMLYLMYEVLDKLPSREIPTIVWKIPGFLTKNQNIQGLVRVFNYCIERGVFATFVENLRQNPAINENFIIRAFLALYGIHRLHPGLIEQTVEDARQMVFEKTIRPDIRVYASPGIHESPNAEDIVAAFTPALDFEHLNPEVAMNIVRAYIATDPDLSKLKAKIEGETKAEKSETEMKEDAEEVDKG